MMTIDIYSEQAEWLEHQCDRLTYGKCTTLSCLKRGGYDKSKSYGNSADAVYELATCIPREIYTELFQQ